MSFLLSQFLPYQLAVAAAHVSREFSTRYRREFGLSIPEWRVLAHIAAEDGVPELSRAFDQLQAVQCGYCASGIIVKAAELLRVNPTPDEQTVRAALDRNLCRCGAHQRMVKAVLRAAEIRRG